MNTAVPGTRLALPAADLMNTAIGIAASRIRSIISCRPFCQVVSRMKTTSPTSSGNQPPSGTLVRFEVKYMPSMNRNTARNSRTAAAGHFHTRFSSTPTMQVEMNIVPVTAIPYAAARLDDSRKNRISMMTMIISAQLIAGI